MGATVTREPGPGSARLAELEALGGTATDVGSQGPGGTATGPHPGGGGSVAAVLARHEFGVGVPRRSVLAGTLAEQRTTLAAIVRQGIAGAHSPEQVSSAVGGWLVAKMRERLAAGIDPALEDDPDDPDDRGPADRPLVDTGAIDASLRWAHRGKGEG
jgi:hypothetical protein